METKRKYEFRHNLVRRFGYRYSDLYAPLIECAAAGKPIPWRIWQLLFKIVDQHQSMQRKRNENENSNRRTKWNKLSFEKEKKFIRKPWSGFYFTPVFIVHVFGLYFLHIIWIICVCACVCGLLFDFNISLIVCCITFVTHLRRILCCSMFDQFVKNKEETNLHNLVKISISFRFQFYLKVEIIFNTSIYKLNFNKIIMKRMYYKDASSPSILFPFTHCIHLEDEIRSSTT